MEFEFENRGERVSYNRDMDAQMNAMIESICTQHGVTPEQLKTAISEAVMHGGDGKEVDNERLLDLIEVKTQMEFLFGDCAEITTKLRPAFDTGSVKVSAEVINLDAEKIATLRSILKECETLSMEPLTNGKIDLAVTVVGLFKDKEPE